MTPVRLSQLSNVVAAEIRKALRRWSTAWLAISQASPLGG